MPEAVLHLQAGVWLGLHAQLALRIGVLLTAGVNVLAFPAVLAFDGPIEARNAWFPILWLADALLWLDVAACFFTPLYDEPGDGLDHAA